MQKVQWMTPKPALSNSSIEAGELAEQRGEYLEAAGAYETALDDPDPLVVAMAHNCLGKLAWQQGQYDASYAAFEKARSIATRHDNLDARARAEIGLGNVHYAKGEYAKARELYDAVRRFAVSPGVRGKVLLNLGIIANIEGDFEDADRSYRRAIKAFAEASDSFGQAQAYHNLGMLHADRLEWDEADGAYAKALEFAGETGNREMVGLVTMNRSELSCAMGRYQEAIVRCDEALSVFAEIGAEVLRGTTLRWKGRALRELAQYPLSERALTESMRIAHRAQARLLEGEAMQELGATLALSGDKSGAKKWMRRAHERFISLGATREVEETLADLKALEDGA
jgi:tetratricopeptide (TPR) repeat protein